jgi:hypothetical protein
MQIIYKSSPGRTSSPTSVYDPMNSPPYQLPLSDAHDFESNLTRVDMWKASVGFVEDEHP